MKVIIEEEKIREFVSQGITEQLNLKADPEKMVWDLGSCNHGEDPFVKGLTIKLEKRG